MTSLARLAFSTSALFSLLACQALDSEPITLSESEADCQVTQPFRTTDFDADFAEDMNALMRDMMERGMAPGGVIEIRQNGETVFSRAYGYADLERRKAMSTDSLFRIYSMTKPVTTIAALQLVDRGDIDLDAPISDYLPEFRDIEVATDESGMIRRIPDRPPTVRDLMRHTTGLTYRTGAKTHPIAALYAEYGVPAGPGVSDPPTNGLPPVKGDTMFIDRISQMPLKHDPGGAFTYGNSTDVLGALVARVSGQALSDYMEENIFNPLGLSDTGFHLPADRVDDFTSAYLVPAQAPAGRAVDMAVPIRDLKPQTPFRLDAFDKSFYASRPDFEFGGAGLISDANDYLVFTQALMDGSSGLISPTLWDEASRDQLPDDARAGAAFLGKRGFGLGFAVREAPTFDEPVFPQCGLFWAGAASTYFWIDEETNTTGVFMTQVFEGDIRSYFSEIVERIYTE